MEEPSSASAGTDVPAPPPPSTPSPVRGVVLMAAGAVLLYAGMQSWRWGGLMWTAALLLVGVGLAHLSTRTEKIGTVFFAAGLLMIIPGVVWLASSGASDDRDGQIDACMDRFYGVAERRALQSGAPRLPDREDFRPACDTP